MTQEQIPPLRAYRVTDIDDAGAARERVFMAHVMTLSQETGALCFHTWRLETLAEQPYLSPYCTDVIRHFDEAHEIPMVAGGKGEKAH